MEKKRILVIDDEENFAKMVQLNLEETGMYEVRYETRGKQGPVAAREFQPHLIFLDIVMPDADGGEVLELLRKDPAISGIPVVFLTAILTEKEAVGFQGVVGGRPFLAKPVTTAKLIESIKRNIKPL